MKIIVDADACPVKEIIEKIAEQYNIGLILVSNPNHRLTSDWGEIITVDSASQSADIAIANLAGAGDIIVTQDYGLASMVLAKKAAAISPGGNVYTIDNIDSLLMQRFINYRARLAGKRIKGPRKRSPADDQKFQRTLISLLLDNT